MMDPVNVFVGKIRDYAGSRPQRDRTKSVSTENCRRVGGCDLGIIPDGDQQAEKKIHGGPDRALCHYPREHYADWIRDFLVGRAVLARRRSAKTSPPPGLPSKTFISAISIAGARH